jgi:uncharacterized protein
MTTLVRVAAALALAAGTALAQTGDYLGAVQLGAVRLRVALHITKTDEGKFAGKLDSLDQGARGLPVNLTIDGRSVKFGSGFGMSYEGTLREAGDGIDGFMMQGGQRVQLDFKKVDKIEEARRPQTPQRPFPYTEEEVSVSSGPAVRLGGTLSLPKGEGPFPAVIFLTGSGAQDRDESLFEHKPFLVLSDRLVKEGIATLRLDDRGVGKSSGNLGMSTLEDLAGDALAAFEYLKTRKEIRPKQIGFLGHSEGGVVAPMAAVKAAGGDVAFLILMAAPTVSGDQVMFEQGQAALKSTGASPEVLAFQGRFHKTFLPLVIAERDNNVLRGKLAEAFEKWKAEDAMARSMDRQIGPQLQQYLVPVLQSFIRTDPGPYLSQLKCPVLALNGTLDTQVLHYQNLPALAASLAKTNHPDYTLVSLPGLNHLLQTAKTGSLNEYGQIEETIAPRVLDLIAQWLKTRI